MKPFPSCSTLCALHGELLCLNSRVDYLREAMPFDRIEVALSARCVEECRVILDFEYFKLFPENHRHKLAAGSQQVIWIERDARNTPVKAPFPAMIRDSLLASLPAQNRGSRRKTCASGAVKTDE